MQLALWMLATVSAAWAQSSPLITEFEWKYFDYVWESEVHRLESIVSGEYNPRNLIPIDVDRSADGRTFVTIIRSPGVPASLNTVSNSYGESGPLLIPYPNWAWHKNIVDCNGITNVFRITIDPCNRLWVLDTGKINGTYVCPAQLLVFNLETDNLLFKVMIPDNIAQNANGTGSLVTPVLETYGPTCDKVTVFMADNKGHALVVWDGFNTYRLEAEAFRPEIDNSDFSIAGVNFHLEDGLLALALAPIRNLNGRRFIFFKPLSSRSLYAVQMRDLWKMLDGTKVGFFTGKDVFPSQVSTMAISSEGILFYGLTREVAIGCWSIHNNNLSSQKLDIAIQDRERLQFVSGMKIITKYGQEHLLMLSNRIQKYYTRRYNVRDTNFRILRAPVKDLLTGAGCNVNKLN